MLKENKVIKEIVPYVVIVILVVLIKTFIFTPVIVNGESMMNTLHENDIMILNKIGMKMDDIDRFDIVVIQTENSKIIKRIIGLPGETIEYKKDELYINGKKVDDPYGNGYTYDIEKVEVPKGEYYVLGDNRNDSIDSRSGFIGTVSRKDILGKATFTIYPFNRIGTK